MTLIVNGEKVDDSLIEQEAEHLRPHYEQVFSEMEPKEREAQLQEWSRENVIERVVLEQEAKSRGVSLPEDEVASAFSKLKAEYAEQGHGPEQPAPEKDKSIKQNIELQIRIERLLQDVTSDIGEPSAEAVSKFYEHNKERFMTPEQVRVAHIVKHINGHTGADAAAEMMKKAGDELKAGTLFEMLVEKYSDCPDNGGDLGYISRGQMVEEFEDVVFNLGAGQTSDVFRTRFGFHIAKLYDRKPAALISLEQAEKTIAQQLKEQMRSDAIDLFVDELKSKAQIKEV